MDYRKEENNYPKAFAATGIILAVVIALSYFIVFKMPPKEEQGTGGILVNYGTVDEGMGNDYTSMEEPSVAEKANHVRPDKVTKAPPTEQPTPDDNNSKQVVTQDNEDAPAVASSKKPTENVKAQQEVTKTTAKPTVNQNALYKGATNNGTGAGDGTGDKPGNQGKPTGTTLTNNYNGTGSGNGGNLNMGQRNFISRPQPSISKTVTGTVVIDIIADKEGNITYAAVGRGTTVSDPDVIQSCIDAAKRVRVNASDTAPDQQRGTIVYKLKAQ
ncbi:energy transducer TonB [Mucilaginibacter sp. RS28]|uniref:Energy transducer TonB n=1 Tax=Mucilaginibacter straminoryzae TaxID=2932774 RepID=A0A9X2BBX0_9SPHI|nr:energy transducer TonB [Mucilaginibacter straminoryzae]MCJ8210287.1 energy transducer TonB [Mucilaginibacter straminoryzae]